MPVMVICPLRVKSYLCPCGSQAHCGLNVMGCAGMLHLHQLAKLKWCEYKWSGLADPSHLTFAYLLWSVACFKLSLFNLRQVHLHVTHGKTSWCYSRVPNMREQSTLYVQILVLINTTLTLRSKVFIVVVILIKRGAVLVAYAMLAWPWFLSNGPC